MTAKEELLVQAPSWTEAEATAALRVLELDAREDAWAEQNALEAVREERW